MIKLKRVHEAPAQQDGLRVLVDNLWPRGIKKEDAAINHWLREIAPSAELRKWFGHDPIKWQSFCDRYAAELETKPDVVNFLRERSRGATLTLVFAARDTEHNNAVALKRYLESR